MKLDRHRVYEKYGGRCAYCGEEIDFWDMQIDHIFPKHKEKWVKHKGMKSRPDVYGHIPDDINEFDNLNPSCRGCNFNKRTYDIEGFRNVIENNLKMCSKYYPYKMAKKYGLIVETNKKVEFYFERKIK